MDYKKTGTTFIVSFLFLPSFLLMQEFITKQFLSQDYINYKDVKNKLTVFLQDLTFEKMYDMYLNFYVKHQLVKKSKTLYTSTVSHLRRAILKIVSKNAKRYKRVIEEMVTKYTELDSFADIIKLLDIVPINTTYYEIWIKVIMRFLEEGDCYKIRYIFDKFKINVLLPRLFLLGHFCFKKKITKYSDNYSFSLSQFALKGSIDFLEDLNATIGNTRRDYFANYGFVKYNDYLLFYNGNVLYKLSFEENNVSVEKMLDGLGDLDEVYSYKYTSNKKEYLVTFREVFNTIANKNNLYMCQMFDKEDGVTKIITRNNILFGRLDSIVPMKYPRFFRNFVVYNLVTKKIEYFFAGNKKGEFFDKFSCQNIFELSKRLALISGVFGERNDPFFHSVLKFDVDNKKILWQTYINSGFVERNLFGNPVYESWSSPLSCDFTSCIFANDLGAVVSIDHAKGSINWLLSLPVYKFKATLMPGYFDKLPYFTENKPPIINGRDVFLQIVSNPNVYKISVFDGRVIAGIFDGSSLEEGNPHYDTIVGPETFYYGDAPRFFYKYKTHMFLIYDLYFKVKDVQSGKEIYKQSFLSHLSGKPLFFMNMLFVPLSREIIILSLDSFKILYHLPIKHDKIVASYYHKRKLYILFKNALWVINVKSEKR